MASNRNNRMDLTFQLLSCWFHFRITLPHIYGISDYFQITTGRGWTITWMGEWCFDTPRVCNTVFLNLKLSNIYSAYDSRRSHLQLHAGMIKPSQSHLLRCPWEKVTPKRKLDPADTLFPLNKVLLYHCLEIHTSIHQGFGDLSWLLKVNIICGKERGKAAINKQLMVSGAFRYWGGKHKKEAPEVLRLSIPFSPRQVSCGKQHCFIEVNVTVLPLMLLFCQ